MIVQKYEFLQMAARWNLRVWKVKSGHESVMEGTSSSPRHIENLEAPLVVPACWKLS